MAGVEAAAAGPPTTDMFCEADFEAEDGAAAPGGLPRPRLMGMASAGGVNGSWWSKTAGDGDVKGRVKRWACCRGDRKLAFDVLPKSTKGEEASKEGIEGEESAGVGGVGGVGNELGSPGSAWRRRERGVRASLPKMPESRPKVPDSRERDWRRDEESCREEPGTDSVFGALASSSFSSC